MSPFPPRDKLPPVESLYFKARCSECREERDKGEIEEFNGKCAACSGYVYWTGPTVCRICGNHSVDVMPIKKGDPAPESMECSRCHNMACDPEDE